MRPRQKLLSLLMTPLVAMAGEVTSPNGNVKVKFYTDVNGRPTYEMTYKDRPVVLPSHLGLELARDKHASMGMDEHDLLDGFNIVSEQLRLPDQNAERINIPANPRHYWR